MTWAIDERNVSLKHERRAALATVYLIGFLRVKGLEAVGCLAAWALVELGIGVTKLDCDVTQFLTEQTYGLWNSKLDKFQQFELTLLTFVPETERTSVDLPWAT